MATPASASPRRPQPSGRARRQRSHEMRRLQSGNGRRQQTAILDGMDVRDRVVHPCRRTTNGRGGSVTHDTAATGQWNAGFCGISRAFWQRTCVLSAKPRRHNSMMKAGACSQPYAGRCTHLVRGRGRRRRWWHLSWPWRRRRRLWTCAPGQVSAPAWRRQLHTWTSRIVVHSGFPQYAPAASTGMDPCEQTYWRAHNAGL